MRLDRASMTKVTSTIFHSDEDFDENDDRNLLDQKHKLVKRIGQLVGQEYDNTPLNVAIIGPMGVGKSSFINTLAAGLSGERWREYAYCGSHGGDGSQITVFTDSYPKCAMEKNEMFRDINLPTFIDIAGFNDEDNEKWVELLRIVLFGRLPKEESLAEAEQYYRENGLNGLIERYSNNNEELKVDRIIFVSAATNPVPTNLIKAVIKVARPSGIDKTPFKRAIPLFGIMTKADKIGGPDLTQEEYEMREAHFLDCLGLQGSRHRFLLCRNYCDDVDVENKRTDTVLPELDVPVLKFMLQVCDPVIKVMNKKETYTTLRAPTQAEHGDREPDVIARLIAGIGLSNSQLCYVVLAVEALIVALLLNWISQPPTQTEKLKVACNYAKRRGELGFFEDICASVDGSSVGSLFYLSVWGAQVLLRYGVFRLWEMLPR